MQVCTKCKKNKDDNEFNKNHRCKSGLNSWCRQCERENSRRRYVERSKQPPLDIATKVCYHCKKEQKIELFHRSNSSKDGWNAVCRICSTEALRTPDGKKRRMCHSAKAKSKKRGIPYNITPEDFEIPTHCPILGIELCLNHTPGGPKDDAPSLDRFVPSKGYVRGNVAVISQRANRMKNDATVDELKSLLNYLENNC